APRGRAGGRDRGRRRRPAQDDGGPRPARATPLRLRPGLRAHRGADGRTLMAIVRYVLARMKPGVTREDYERFEREVDCVVSSRLKTIVSYRTHRITEVGETLKPFGW